MESTNMEYEVDLNKAYEDRLEKFKKYQIQGIDLAWRCYRCSKIVLNTDISKGIGCRKCGSLRVSPITADLTWLGLGYCLYLKWIRRLYDRAFCR
jgi:DNA-directed RNA polymerase subunit RPC12/RpoP